MKKIIIVFLAMMLFACCSHDRKCKPNDSEDSIVDEIENSVADKGLEEDSFIVKYSNQIQGYSVKAVVKTNYEPDCTVLSADLYFTKNGRTFMLHSSSFGDTLYNHGRYDPEGFNITTFNKYRGKTIKSVYTAKEESKEELMNNVPFFFKDVDFDDIPELLIVHHGAAVRWHDGYDVYRIVEGTPVYVDSPPYNQNKEEWGFGMTDYPEFDYNKKTITCPFPEGERSYEGFIIYGIDQKERSVIVENGHKHYYNKMIVKL